MADNTENFDRASVLRHFEGFMAQKDDIYDVILALNGHYMKQRVKAFRSWLSKILFEEMMREYVRRGIEMPFAERLPLLKTGGSGKEVDKNGRHLRDSNIVAVLERRYEMTSDDKKVFMFTEKAGRRSLIHELADEINVVVAKRIKANPHAKSKPLSLSPEYIRDDIWKKKSKLDPIFLSTSRDIAAQLDPSFRP